MQSAKCRKSHAKTQSREVDAKEARQERGLQESRSGTHRPEGHPTLMGADGRRCLDCRGTEPAAIGCGQWAAGDWGQGGNAKCKMQNAKWGDGHFRDGDGEVSRKDARPQGGRNGGPAVGSRRSGRMAGGGSLAAPSLGWMDAAARFRARRVDRLGRVVAAGLPVGVAWHRDHVVGQPGMNAVPWEGAGMRRCPGRRPAGGRWRSTRSGHSSRSSGGLARALAPEAQLGPGPDALGTVSRLSQENSPKRRATRGTRGSTGY